MNNEKPKKGNATGGIVLVCVVSVVILIVIGLWNLKRSFHYSIAYESKVEDTVREMVRPECLKDTYR